MVATILLGLSPVLIQYTNVISIAAAIISMSIVHTFLDIIPSTFLGAPDENNIMSALPAHKLLLEGKGFEAVKLATTGSFLGLVLVTAMLPLLLVAVPFIFTALQEYIGIILIIVVAGLILKEKKFETKFWSFFIFMLSGIMGIIVFSLPLEEPLLPMLSGLFGVSTLLSSISQKVHIPQQRITNEIHVSKRELAKSTFAGTLSGTLVSIFPGMGPAQAAIVGGSFVGEIKEHLYLVLVGAIGTVSMALSLITLYTIDKARNGSIIVVQEMLSTVSFELFLLMMIISLLAGCIGVFLTMMFVRLFSKLVEKINYQWLCIGIIIFVMGLVMYITGFLGFGVLMTATAIGMLPERLQIGRNHAMGCLLLPVILYFIL